MGRYEEVERVGQGRDVARELPVDLLGGAPRDGRDAGPEAAQRHQAEPDLQDGRQDQGQGE